MDSNDGLEEKIPGVNADSNDAFFPLSRQTRRNSQCSLSIETSFQGSTRTRLPPKIANDNLLQHSGPELKFLTIQVAINSSFPSLTVHGVGKWRSSVCLCSYRSWIQPCSFSHVYIQRSALPIWGWIQAFYHLLLIHGTEIRPQSSDSSHFGTHGHPIESANRSLAELAGFPPRRIDVIHTLASQAWSREVS